MRKANTDNLDLRYLQNPTPYDETDSFDTKYNSTDSDISLPGILDKTFLQNNFQLSTVIVYSQIQPQYFSII